MIVVYGYFSSILRHTCALVQMFFWLSKMAAILTHFNFRCMQKTENIFYFFCNFIYFAILLWLIHIYEIFLIFKYNTIYLYLVGNTDGDTGCQTSSG